MSNDFRNYEPPVNPDDDTHPTQTVPQVMLNQQQRPPRPGLMQRLLGLVLLLGAAGLTFATIYILMTPTDTSSEPVVIVAPTDPVTLNPTNPAQPTDTLAPTMTVVQPADAETNNTDGAAIATLPTLDPETAQSILQQPLQSFRISDALQIQQPGLNPFTIVPNRPRSEFITYEVVSGDTIDAIAQRFGLQPESIAWTNTRRIVQVLRPGDIVNIPPVDGVSVEAFGSNTIADYAETYQVDDPYIIIDSEFNDLRNYTPDTIPPSGTQIFIPGGQGELIVWRAEIEVTGGGGSAGGGAAPGTVQFQANQPGDCGPVPIGGGSFWTNPVPSGNYIISRGFSGTHPGIDLARAEGIPIAAANGGTVIFAGWNGFGYGNMVAIIHGPNMTVYGHLSQVNVGCYQEVAAGEIIGLMGNTGNSSGPHLHFEIRGGPNYAPINPAAIIGF